MKLKKELSQFIRKDKDSFIIFKSRDNKWLTKEFWGVQDDKTSNFFYYDLSTYNTVKVYRDRQS